MTDDTVDDLLRYHRNPDLRERLSRHAGVEPGDRYRERDGGVGMPKEVVAELAHDVGVDSADSLSLEGLYREICKALDMEPPASTGNLWKLRRAVLKELVRRLCPADSTRP